ncbi:glycosyltransferase [Marinimicrobium sp. ABcell2]|uniref:glycosyltransferase n=1 Tax=Marinimicrobium sp. ABcell2 TaxID=3069751 RepID=UPI0027B52CE3|nr:glycosyltransferase [Marinimicrobium sp. ABcell2]MDQ2076181.1 glycosyltransferase [Marinimicrobium sp. ABcell2]
MSESPLRVMHIISGDLWAGAEVQAYTLLSHLKHQCELQVVLMNPGRLEQELKRLNVPVVVLDETSMGSLAIVRQLRRQMNGFQPHIVHTHRQKENILGSIANVLSVRAKSIRTSHGAPEFAPRGLQRLQVMADRLTGRFLQQGVIAVSANLHLKLQHLFPERMIHVIHNGIDVPALQSKVKTADFRQSEPEHVHIGIIGRLEPVKRIDLFLSMVPAIVAHFPERQFRFHVIGDGRLREQLQQQAESLGVARWVRFHGHREDMPACISSLDLIVMCSDHEGTPMTALESLALGTPLIAHDVGGLTEILAAYPQLLVQDHSVEGYAQQVIHHLSGKGPQDVALGHSYRAETNAVGTRQLYDTLLQPALAKLGNE